MAKKEKNKFDTLRLIVGCFFALAGIYTLLGLGSYLFTWSIDQSLLSNDNVLNTIVPVENLGGKLGFFWADILVGKLFGVGAFIIPFFLLALAVYCLHFNKVRVIWLFFMSAFGCVIVSLACTYVFSFTSWQYLFGNGAGGAYGYYVNEWLCNMLGKTGAGLLILFALIVWLSLLSWRFSAWCMKVLGKRSPSANKKRDEKALEEKEGEAQNNDEPAVTPEVAMPEVEMLEVLEPEVEDADKDAKDIENAVEMQVEPQTDETVSGETIPPGENLPEFEIEETEDDIPAGDIKIYDPGLDLPRYKCPGFDLLDDYKDKMHPVTREEWERNNIRITNTLREYKITIEKIVAVPGPTVTLYKIVLSPGIRISQIKRLEDDIAMSLAARGVRVIAPIPGTNAVGIEVANENPSIVSMRSVLDSQKFKDAKYDLPVVLGKTISNEVYAFDLAKMPHLLVAGATGQGKSVGLNAIITSLLYKMHPAYLKFVLVDPKKVELSLYAHLEKHFLAKLPDSDEAIITDTKKVVHTLQSLCTEMDNRYNLLKLARVRNIKEYNQKFLERRLNPLKGHKFMPFIVVVVDEFSDLIITAGREVEEPLTRLAQLARAIGIHLVIATQRPTTNIITGTIKANFPARIAFRVISNIDSRTILDQAGANQLIGKGDMLISTGSEMNRVQCAFVDTPEIERIVNFIGDQQGYASAFDLPEYVDKNEEVTAGGFADGRIDELFSDAARIIVSTGQGSTSLLQRKMNLGYNRAGRIMDQLEAAGIVGPSEGSKARQVLITSMESLDEILSRYQ